MVAKIDFNINETNNSIFMLISRLQALLNLLACPFSEEHRSIEIDLSDCEYFGPVGVAILGLLVRALRAKQYEVTVIPPSLPQLRGYSEYSGFAELCWHGPSANSEHPQNETTPLVFTSIRRTGDVGKVVRLVQRHCHSAMSQDMIQSLQTLLAELLMNIQDHAGAEGVLTARWFPSDQTVRVVIADLGVGLRTTLAQRYEVTSDKRAIELALTERKTSSSQKHNLGAGLPTVQALMAHNKGDLFLVSGDAIFSYCGLDHRPQPKVAMLGSGITLPGTLCALKFRIDHDIYDRDDDDTDSVQW